jgi:hypothetical protein
MRTIIIDLEAGETEMTGDMRDISLPEWMTLVTSVLAAAKASLDEESWETVLATAAMFGEYTREK